MDKHFESITSILQRTLDVDPLLDLDDPSANESKSSGKVALASETLLKERKKSKQTLDTGLDFISLQPQKSTAHETQNSYLGQIASSSVEDPKYWNSNAGNTSSGRKNNDCQSYKKGRTKNKVHKAQRKGQDYTDRYAGKISSKLLKKQRIGKIKSTA